MRFIDFNLKLIQPEELWFCVCVANLSVAKYWTTLFLSHLLFSFVRSLVSLDYVVAHAEALHQALQIRVPSAKWLCSPLQLGGPCAWHFKMAMTQRVQKCCPQHFDLGCREQHSYSWPTRTLSPSPADKNLIMQLQQWPLGERNIL